MQAHTIPDPTTVEQALARVARDRGFSMPAVETLWEALVQGRGTMARFSHPELGGNGQWMRFGMAMVGDRFNLTLASRVGALGDSLALLHTDLHEQGHLQPDDAVGWRYAPSLRSP